MTCPKCGYILEPFFDESCPQCARADGSADGAVSPPAGVAPDAPPPSLPTQRSVRPQWLVWAAVGATLVLASLCCGLFALVSMLRAPTQPEVPNQQPSAPATTYKPPAASYQPQQPANSQQQAPQGEMPHVVTQEEQDRELAYQRELQRQAYLARQARQQGTYRQAPAYGAGTSGDAIVYVTDTGKKYHRAGCRHLRGSSHPMALSEAQAQGYTACSNCF